MPRITDFCSCIYVLGCRLSLVTLCDSGFGITPVDDITIGITCAAFFFHKEHIIIIIIIIIITIDIHIINWNNFLLKYTVCAC